MQEKSIAAVTTIESARIRLNIHQGEEPWLVCFPGLGLDGSSFLSALPQAQGSILVDYKDYESGEFANEYGLEITAEEISHIFEKNNISGSMIAVSHSMGSIVAGLTFDKLKFESWLNFEGNLDPADCFFSRRVVQNDLEIFVGPARSDFFETLHRVADINREPSLKSYINTLENVNLSALWYHAKDTVLFTDNEFAKKSYLNFPYPKLYIMGDKTKPGETVVTASAADRFKVEIIANSGHFIMQDNPGDVAQCMQNFIKS